MTTVKLNITARREENYNTPEAPYWKPKGTVEFNVDVPDDYVLYEMEEVRLMLAEVIGSECNDHERFEIVNIELEFHDPINVQAKFDRLLDAHQKSQQE